jgi:hypothetical protein
VSTTAAALTVAVVLTVSLPAAWWQIRRAARHESERDRLIAAHDVGPDNLRLLEDTDAYLDRIAAGDPELNAGLDRLRHELTHREENP